MSKISLEGNVSGSGTLTIAAPNTNSNFTLTLPTETGTIITNSGNQAGSFTTLNTSGAVVFNDAGADVDFRVEGDTETSLLFVDASTDRVGIGTPSPSSRLEIIGVNPKLTINANDIVNGRNATLSLISGASADPSSTCQIMYGASNSTGDGILTFVEGDGTERMRIVSSGNVLVGKTTAAYGIAGTELYPNGEVNFVKATGTVVFVNRLTDDGVLVEFAQGSITEGTITVLNNDVSYNPFLGSHAGALDDWSRTDIKVGTVMDTINELLEYKVVVIDVQEDIPAKDAVLDEEGNEIEPAQKATTQTVQKRISYNGNGAVGSTATIEYEGQEYTGVIEHERKIPSTFNKHLKVKINDTAASKTVFGVFVGWNNDPNNDGGVYNDMLVGAVGNYVIRMAAGQTPEAGDLVEADGNGCAVVQDDDIIRTKTIAKVTSTIPQVTYDDGSFLVTCVLYCG